MSYTRSRQSIAKPERMIVRPLSRKDIFYSGSIVNLPEYQSQKSLQTYRQSQLSLSRGHGTRGDVDVEKVEREC